MKLFTSCLFVCAILGIAQAQIPQDTAETAAAKAAHFEAVRRAENIIANAPPPPLANNIQHRRPVEETSQHKLGLNVHDTPEVAAAKAAHYAAVRDAAEATAIANSTASYPESYAGVHHQQQHQYRSPAVYSPPPPTQRPASIQYHQSPSVPIVQTSQHKLGVNVQETPEVAAAKAAHFEAVRRAEQAAAASGSVDYEDTYVMVPNYQNLAPIVPAAPVVRAHNVVAGPRFVEQMGHYGQRAHQVMYAPQTYEQNIGYRPEMIAVVAVPQTNQHKLGLNVEDTPEVAAAKKAHFEAFRQAAQVAAAASARDQNEYAAPSNNYFANPTRQYGQVNY